MNISLLFFSFGKLHSIKSNMYLDIDFICLPAKWQIWKVVYVCVYHILWFETCFKHILCVRLTSSILMVAMLDDKHIQYGGMLCLSARNLLTWIIILQWVFCALCMVVDITACGMAPRGFLDFQKSLKWRSRKKRRTVIHWTTPPVVYEH